ncbi:MAG TPA: hypothetical protein VFB80_08785 [Pirellulaceae bacterium]|nr:hypothetical protein [Pirellulaceae bacterium]
MSNLHKQLPRRGFVGISPMGWPPGTRRLRRHFGNRAPVWRYRPLGIESLEDRALLTVSLSGVPLWIEQGPGTMTNGSSEGIPDEPVAGAVNVVAPDPVNANRLFAGSVNGGIWRTTDATSPNPHWTPLTDQFRSLSVTSLEFSPLDPAHNTLFAGTGSTSSGGGDGGPAIGLLKTTDGGQTWSVLGGPVTGSGANFGILQVIPTAIGTPATQVVLVSTSAGVFRSTDGGVTFGMSPVLSGSVTHLVADPANAGRLFAAVPGQGVFRSPDQGQTWDRVLGPTLSVGGFGADYDFLEIAVHYNAGSGTNAIYVAGFFDPEDDSNDDDDVIVLRAPDPGAEVVEWTLMGLPARLGIPRQPSIAAHPANENLVFISSVHGDNLAGCERSGARTSRGDASLDLASQWIQVVCDGASGTAPHVDSRGLVFDAYGNLLETTDGGIYRLRNPASDYSPGTEPFWESVNGDLRTVEFYYVAYDSLNHVTFGGNQDNGTPHQLSPGTPGGIPDDFTWERRVIGDGGVVQVDQSNQNCLVADPCTIRYQSFHFLGGFTREEFDGNNAPVGMHDIQLEIEDSEGRRLTDGQGTLSDASDDYDVTTQFIQAWALNAADPMRLLIGTSYLYESIDQGDHLTAIGGLDDDFSPINPVGAVNRTMGSGSGLGQASPIAYGGWIGNVPYPDVLWIGATQGLDKEDNDGDGDTDESDELTPTLRLRTSGSGLPDIVANYPGGQIRDIALDPIDWRQAYILDASGSVFRAVTDSDGAKISFTDLTGDLTGDLAMFATDNPTIDLRTIEFMRADANTPVLLVGGQGGVYRSINFGAWSELGVNLANAPVTDLHYDALDNVLVAGTFGRGAWTIPLASLNLFASPSVDFCGTDNDDLMVLDTNAGNPLLLDLVLNGVTEASLPYSVLKTVHVCGRDGDDVILTRAMQPWIFLSVDGDADHDIIGFGNEVTIPVVASGGSGNDIIDGTSESDILNGDSGDDHLAGLGGDDLLNGGPDDDTIFGGDDDDLIDGGQGDDSLDGGRGNDNIAGDIRFVLGEIGGNDTIVGDSGNDIIDGDGGDDSLDAGSGEDTLDGGDGNDVLVGGSDADSLSGGDGNDQLLGGMRIASLDALEADPSADTLSGGAGNDTIIADDGSFLPLIVRETIGGNDVVRGGSGNDLIFSGFGNDNVQGQSGDDTIAAGPGNDTVIGGWLIFVPFPPLGDGDDFINGGVGADLLYGDNFDPLLPPYVSLSGGDDELLGGDGDDTIYGQAGHDNLDGGADDDALHGGVGNDELTGGPGTDGLVGDVGTDLLFGNQGPDTLDGGADNDVLVGGSDDDELQGGSGDDVLTGEAGDDLLVGGPGFDTLDGGADDDGLIGGNLGGAGVQADFSPDSLNGGDGDDVLLGDSGSITPFFIPAFDIFGGGDSIQGGPGNDISYGQAGNDFIGGGPGNDIIVCGVGNDIASGDEGSDIVVGDAGDDLLAGGDANDTLTGGSGNDLLVGGVFSAGAMVIAETGDDLLQGDSGEDILFGDSWALGDPLNLGVSGGHDTLRGGPGSDLAVGQTGNDLLFGDAGDDTLLGGDGNDRIRGGDGDDQLGGGAGHDLLLGEVGQDALAGAGGRDVLIGGQGADTLDGGDDDDILIAGTTAHDANDAALNLILAEWTSLRDYESRVKNLKGTNNPEFDNRLNAEVFLKKNGNSNNGNGNNGNGKGNNGNNGNMPTVFDDDASDELTGSSGDDWFLYEPALDELVDWAGGENKN